MLKARARLTTVRPDGAVALFVHPDDRRYVFAQYKDFCDRKIECDVVVTQHHKTRTLPMNDMWEGMCRKIAKDTKNTFNAVRNHIKDVYGAREKITVPVHVNGVIEYQDRHVIKSTADYTIPEFSDLIMGTFEFGADFGVNLTEERKDYDQAKKEAAKA